MKKILVSLLLSFSLAGFGVGPIPAPSIGSFTVSSGGGGGVVIADPVTDGTPNYVLYVDASGNLGQSSKFQFVDSTSTLALNGVLSYGANGSISAPALTWAADTDTGVYRQGSGQIAMALNGSSGARAIQFVDVSVMGLSLPDAVTTFGTPGAGIFMAANAGYFTMGLAGTQPKGYLHISSNSGNPAQIYLENTTNSVNGGNLFLVKARGADPSARSAVSSGDNLGTLRYDGWTTSALFRDGAIIRATTTENWSETNRGTQLSVFNNATGGASLTETWRWAGDGQTVLMRSSGANLIWNTDGGGSIGASGANRPLNIFASSAVNSATSVATTSVTSPSIFANTVVVTPLVHAVDSAVADGATATATTIRGGNKTAGTGDGGELRLYSGSSAGGNGTAVNVIASSAGASTGSGGGVNITGGNNGGGATGSGGDVTLTSGNGGNAAGQISLVGGNSTTDGNGGALSLTAGNGAGTGGGGAIALQAGNSAGGSAGAGGSIDITSGNAGGNNADGGYVSLLGGVADGNGTGGVASLQGGTSVTGNGGDVGLQGGFGGTGGDGGNVALVAGPAGAGGVDGQILITGQVNANGYVLSACEVDDGNSSTADTLDLSTCSAHKSTLTGNVTYTLSNPVTGGTYVIRIATGAGGFGTTWPGNVLWSGGTAPTITAAAGKVDIITLYYDGTSYYGSFTQNY